MFPDAEDAPAELAQLAVHAPVAGLVGGELFQPERATRGRKSGVLRTTVPEATVHKNGKAAFGKGEVGRAGKSQVTSPAGNVMAAKQLCQGEFGGLVAATANPGHDFRVFYLFLTAIYTWPCLVFQASYINSKPWYFHTRLN